MFRKTSMLSIGILRLRKTLQARRADLCKTLGDEAKNLREFEAAHATGDSADTAFEADKDAVSSQLAQRDSRELSQIERALAIPPGCVAQRRDRHNGRKAAAILADVGHEEGRRHSLAGHNPHQDGHENRQVLLGIGADDFIGKPFQEVELFHKIRAHLGAEYVYAEEPAAAPQEEAPSPGSTP
jgi:hypothetical protein